MLYQVRWQLAVAAEHPAAAVKAALKLLQSGVLACAVRFEVAETPCCDTCRDGNSGRQCSLCAEPNWVEVDAQRFAVCANCEECGRIFEIPEDADLATIPNILDRLTPGGLVPVCECPECGALAYPLPDALDL